MPLPLLSCTAILLSVALSAAAAAPHVAKPYDPSQPIPKPRAPSSIPYTYVSLQDSDALCLDGSPYGTCFPSQPTRRAATVTFPEGYFLCRAGDERWEINLQGGGWCKIVRKPNVLCVFRSLQVLQRDSVSGESCHAVGQLRHVAQRS
jgi:hypothetical protein